MQVPHNYLTLIPALSQPCPSLSAEGDSRVGDSWEGDDQEGANQEGENQGEMAGSNRVRREQLGVRGPGGG